MNADKEVAVYDNTVSARTYLSYISEQAGGFACIGRDGKLYIKTIGESILELPLKYFKDYSWGEKIKISRIRYEDGIQLFEAGDETGNTIYIGQDNMYIVDQEQIDNIYNLYKDLEVYSFEGTSIIDPAIDIGDLLLIDGKYVIYQGSSEYKGKWQASITSKIQSKVQEETTTRKVSQTTINRRVQSLIDQVEGKIEQTLLEVDDQNSKLTQIEQTMDSVTIKVENIYTPNISKETTNGLLSFENINNSEPININIHPLMENISYLYPRDNLYPSDDLYMKDRKLRFTNISTQEVFDYELPEDLLINNEDGTYDEFILDYNKEICRVIKKVGYNEDGTTYTLDTEMTINYDYPKIALTTGDYTIELLGYNSAYIYVTLMQANEFTTKFVTKVEVGTQIQQNWESVQIAWNQISQSLKFLPVDDKASLAIYDESDKLLMTLNEEGETFYDENEEPLGKIGIIKQEQEDETIENLLVFSKPIDFSSQTDLSKTKMAWGVTDQNNNFFPVFYLAGVAGEQNGDYSGELVVEGQLSVGKLKILENLILDDLMTVAWGEEGEYGSIMPVIGYNSNFDELRWLTYSVAYGHDFIINGESAFSCNQEGFFLNKELTLNKPIFISYNNKDIGHTGYPIIGIDDSTRYFCAYLNNDIFFYVDGNVVGSLSDKRLKKDIKEIDEKFLDAINEIGIKQFKLKNKNGIISFGIIAQELIEVFNKYNINADDYEILGRTRYSLEDKTEYYKIEYTQFFVLKQLAQDREIEKIKEENKEKDKLLDDLIARIKRLEEKNV